MPRKPIAPAVPGPSPTIRTTIDQSGVVAYEIDVDKINPDPKQPRTEFDPEALDRLATSLATHGQIQPITVTHAEEPFHYVIVTGERRWRAAVQAGQEKIAAVILKGLKSPTHRLEIQLVENLVRQDLSPIEQARAYQTLMTRNGWNMRQLAGFLQTHPGTVCRALALLELPESVRNHVNTGALSPSRAREIARVETPGDQVELASRVVSEGLTRSETLDAVRILKTPSSQPATKQVDNPSKRRVFSTTQGRVIVELDTASGSDALLDAFLEASAQFQDEILASRAAEAKASGRSSQ